MSDSTATAVSKEIEKALFETAVMIDDRDLREGFLDQACSGNEELRGRLHGLIEAHEASDDFFHEALEARSVVAADACANLTELPPDDDSEFARYFPDTTEIPGTWIGRYKIKERIGEGGCGIVYLAEQKDPVQRLVAIKVIRLGMDTASVIARFEMESQSLALMNHPNIAQVLDAGATDTGRPYFVMEWVRGEKITDYCNENTLDIRQRIDLFIEVCHAIQHAHQKGVIHRDIKPSNILVTLHNGKPSPKVIDFGIAKATTERSAGDTLLTSNEHFVGTPAYMSPEQADRKGFDVDTRSDVYSLGVLLYELLVDRTPFDPKELSSAGVLETKRILLDRAPPTPSAMLDMLDRETLGKVAADRHTDPAKLITAVKGDLNWVVMKAIEKDRQRRYETVNGLIMDLKRFIGNEPVIACPPSRVYLFQKFVRRNRFTVASTAGIAAALALGLGLAYTSYLGERSARYDQARLRKIAEAARANETRLRELSAARENIAQVAVMISEGKIAEADAQLQRTPLSSIEPSLEGANVLRSLGGWNAMRGRWAQASECYLLLIHANRISNTDQIIASTDLDAPGPALAANGNMADYDRFREWALSRFADTSNPLAAQQLIQATLILPASPDYLQRLEPLTSVLQSRTFAKDRFRGRWDTEFAAWRCLAMALLDYRRNEFETACYWGELAMDYKPTKPPLTATIHSVLAMAYQRSGNTEDARIELETARKLLEPAFSPELPPAYEPMGAGLGYWWDWVQAQILYREAGTLVQGPSAEQ